MGNRTRVAAIVVALVALATAVVAATARATPPSQGLRLDATVTFSTGWCCGTSIHFEGAAALPHIGAVRYAGNRLAGCDFFPGADMYPCFRHLDVEFVGREGSTFAVVADDAWTFPLESEPAVLTWAIDPERSTGRFTRLSGGGTYTFETNGTTATITLLGSIQRVHSAD
jgi:hypothetical protein